MTILNNYYASGGQDVRLFTLELTCPAWAAPIPLPYASELSHY